MTYAEVISNIRDLGFSDDSEMEEFGELVYNSINRAISEINLLVTPIISSYEFEIDDSDEGYLYLRMPDVNERFLDFADTPVVFEAQGKESYTKFNDFEIETGDTMVINQDNYKGSFRIFFRADHEPIPYADDGSYPTQDQLAQELPLPRKAHFLVPLLAGYYVWLEDEPTKAAQYYNLYEQGVETVSSSDNSKRIRVRVLPGGM